MQKCEFFQGIRQFKVPFGKRLLKIPVFYYDMINLDLVLLAALDKVESILPSKRMHPISVTPKQCMVSISAFGYKNSDVGRYNEVSIGVPFLLDRTEPHSMGTAQGAMETPMVYVWHLPVTTEVAREIGVRAANYPKFLADISFEEKREWISCEVNAAGKHLLTLTGRKVKLCPSPRQHLNVVTLQKNWLLRSEFLLSECELGSSNAKADAKFELGNHPIAEELRKWELDKIVSYQYCPLRQAILTTPIESYPVKL